MHEVNLLPWRQWEHRRTIRRWQGSMLAAVLFGGLLMLACTAQLKEGLAEQLRESARLDERLAGLEGPLAQGAALQAQVQALVEQRNELDALQAQRLGAGDLLAVLARAVPAQVRLDAVQLSGVELSVSGVARSGSEVAQLLWALDRSPGMGPAELRDVERSVAGERFQITVSLRPVAPREAA